MLLFVIFIVVVFLDIADFDDISGMKLEWPDKDNFMRFLCFITPTEGLYKGAKYEWEIVIPNSYPHSPPKCLLKTLPVCIKKKKKMY